MKKLIKHLAKNWFKYLIEISVITLGILGAFALNNWSIQKDRIEQEIKILQSIKSDLQSDLEAEIRPSLIAYENSVKLFDQADAIFEPNDISDDSVAILLEQITREVWIFVFHTTAYENLKSVGVDLITNDSLRLDISSIYSYHYPVALKMQNELNRFNDEHFKGRLNKYISFTNPEQKSYYDVKLGVEKSELQENSELRSKIVWVNTYRLGIVVNILSGLSDQIETLISSIDKEILRLEND